MFSVNYIFLLNITYAFAFITCLGFLVFTLELRQHICASVCTLEESVKSCKMALTGGDFCCPQAFR